MLGRSLFDAILVGVVFDLTHGYQLIFMLLIGLAALSLLLALLFKPAKI